MECNGGNSLIALIKMFYDISPSKKVENVGCGSYFGDGSGRDSYIIVNNGGL